MRVIRKYANRRLYDTQQSRYVTLEDLRHLVLEEEAFRVEDAKSGEDLTRTILLSIITEQEQRHDNDADVFSNALLEQLIRIYAMAQPLPLARYLEQGTQLMLEQQRRMQDQWQQAIRHSPVETMRELAEDNLRFWQRMMRQHQTRDDDTER
ncbi:MULTISPECIES: polyhydroxyalkanoate synthesis repressor PhaR [Chromohalobacter]|uniref:Polyhydroxyalkanoate synthesis repressor PhaR n=1 Tax=Chromohalobacter israelensis (strain ATCC BAA-138 / DSM 3043 / CIP 106854 / NCIMB 13768 / 1H11) TaxID=290398 RepID=Q1QZ43_CHRI1|nr:MULTISPECIES: polyhydroxyalkanoate synthesis repressor PhaR [Chromohalobacter]ABE58265.1 Polyhydroxyalkanoate synthesis repressor PhaR [Chromohalobacter salexigens DSM 3043]MBZ5875670.1 polyhydroxyalkanoate synthesis repressor PhaR [Chromohalobacter salexigens]MDF9433288.1 polyhydroxyalkanoate synthesis repressor PhaR [Chromohalobacter israelensis]MDO0944340.1 polyhydroxyalkanoate synthesis repressor PhaR [Chromohalobacter salexigens]NQY45918.1 polyhydroxyalkanoate synthesis repressor PhaR 